MIFYLSFKKYFNNKCEIKLDRLRKNLIKLTNLKIRRINEK